VCRAALGPADRALRCPRGHSFDQARQGYVDLTAGRITHAGDSAEMVAAREALLAGGHLDPVAEAVAASAGTHEAGLIVEVGAGTGHYLARALDAGPGLDGLAVDVSKPALRRAARAHPRLFAVRADVWHGLPLVDRSAVAVLDVFAPRSGAEFARILRSDGTLVVATPEPDHLAELVTALGLLGVDPVKEERLAARLEPWFAPASTRTVRYPLRLSRADAAALVGMGPSARHLDAATVADRLSSVPEPVVATVSVRVSAWHPRHGPARLP
jgi:23S rRNA (guanine745-N1)-methyltransferase